MDNRGSFTLSYQKSAQQSQGATMKSTKKAIRSFVLLFIAINFLTLTLAVNSPMELAIGLSYTWGEILTGLPVPPQAEINFPVLAWLHSMIPFACGYIMYKLISERTTGIPAYLKYITLFVICGLFTHVITDILGKGNNTLHLITWQLIGFVYSVSAHLIMKSVRKSFALDFIAKFPKEIQDSMLKSLKDTEGNSKEGPGGEDKTKAMEKNIQ